MKVFTNCTVVLEFESSTSYKEKCTWRKTITDNGGVISYILTKKASFFVVFNKRGTSISYKLRQCGKHSIPVVSPKYIQQCVTKNRLLDTSKYRLPDSINNEEFGKGKIQMHNEGGTKHVKKKVATVNLSSHPSFLFGDVNAPEFEEDTFQMPKWSLLINKESKKMAALEVHVATRLDCKFKYRLYAQSAQVDSNKVIKIEEAIVWYFQTVSEALSGYEQLYRQYTNKPVSMVLCVPGAVEVGDFGSSNLRMKIGKLSLLNEDISPQVAALTSIVWNEALTEVDNMLETPMKYIQEKQIMEAKVILAQLTDILLSNQGNNVDKLIEEFYDVLPHKEQFKTSNWTLREVIGKQDLCQLLSDIVAVSEATDWSPDTTIIAKYRAMGCHIQHVDQTHVDDSAEIFKILEQKLSKDGGKIHSLYKVRRTVEEVNFMSDVGNIQLLSHASPCYNVLGILSRGLLMPNMVADKMGVARTDAGNLGAGIYFSDNPLKSSQYSTVNSQTGSRIMLLCNVSLGHCCEMYQSDTSITSAPEGFDSVHGVKSTPSKPSTFEDNEFVIYNPSQQCVKYLVDFSLPGDSVKECPTIGDRDLQALKDSGVTNNDPLSQKPSNTDIDISDIKDVPDPLAKVKAGLQGNKKEHIPLKRVHIRGRMMDMVAKVVVLQAYRNDSDTAIEAKYVFPLDDKAAVCGFEAFINGKHIIGKVKEKSKARKEYKEAVARGDGAYLMEEETPDVFSVSVGNLPPNCDVLIKITYISELQVQGEAITFTVPASVAPWLQDGALSQKTQTTTGSVKVSDNKRCEISLMVAIEMPFDIRRIVSPSHMVKCKKTATKAVVALPRKSKLDDGFQLLIYLAEVHVPRMWVEKHPHDNTQACMLTFYPEFETQSVTEADIVILLDTSNSMKGKPEEQAKKVAILAMENLPVQCKFNIVIFGSTYKELFPSPQSKNNFSTELGKQFIQESFASLGSTELLGPLHATQILSSAVLSSADQHSQNLFLISDGHVTQESLVLKAAQSTSQKIRIFTLGVSSTVNHHLLRSLSSLSGGTYQHFNPDTKSQWKGKLLSQLEKACQPSLCNVYVDWLQTNEKATPPTQAPNHIPCLFSGCRQVVYGFVESCTQATLKAKIGSDEISTMVSTVDLNITRGTMLHQLTARAVITDYENGSLDDDRIRHQVMKNEKKQYIIDLSKKYSIVTPYTSFVAIEDRQQDDYEVSIIPSIDDLIEKETVDILPYIGWEPGVEETDEDPIACVKNIIRKGEILEGYSMTQAEDFYNSLLEYIEEIKTDGDTLELVYNKLGTFYMQNQAETIGNILAQLEENTINHQLRRLNELSVNDYEAYLKYKSDLKDTWCDKRHLENVPDWLFENELIDNRRETRCLDDVEETNYHNLMTGIQMPSLMPPEINISDEEISNFQQLLANVPEIILPFDDDFDSPIERKKEKEKQVETKSKVDTGLIEEIKDISSCSDDSDSDSNNSSSNTPDRFRNDDSDTSNSSSNSSCSFRSDDSYSDKSSSTATHYSKRLKSSDSKNMKMKRIGTEKIDFELSKSHEKKKLNAQTKGKIVSSGSIPNSTFPGKQIASNTARKSAPVSKPSMKGKMIATKAARKSAPATDHISSTSDSSELQDDDIELVIPQPLNLSKPDDMSSSVKQCSLSEYSEDNTRGGNGEIVKLFESKGSLQAKRKTAASLPKRHTRGKQIDWKGVRKSAPVATHISIPSEYSDSTDNEIEMDTSETFTFVKPCVLPNLSTKKPHGSKQINMIAETTNNEQTITQGRGSESKNYCIVSESVCGDELFDYDLEGLDEGEGLEEHDDEEEELEEQDFEKEELEDYEAEKQEYEGKEIYVAEKLPGVCVSSTISSALNTEKSIIATKNVDITLQRPVSSGYYRAGRGGNSNNVGGNILLQQQQYRSASIDNKISVKNFKGLTPITSQYTQHFFGFNRDQDKVNLTLMAPSYSPCAPGCIPAKGQDNLNQTQTTKPDDRFNLLPSSRQQQETTLNYSPTSPSYSPTSPCYTQTSTLYSPTVDGGVSLVPPNSSLLSSTTSVAASNKDRRGVPVQDNSSELKSSETLASNTITKYFSPDFDPDIFNAARTSRINSNISGIKLPTYHYPQTSSFISSSDCMMAREDNKEQRRLRTSRSGSRKRDSVRSLKLRSRSISLVRKSRSRSVKRRSRSISIQRRSRSRSSKRRSISIERKSRSRSINLRSKSISVQRMSGRSRRSLEHVERSRSRSRSLMQSIRRRQLSRSRSRSRSRSLMPRNRNRQLKRLRSRSRSRSFMRRIKNGQLRRSRSKSRSRSLMQRMRRRQLRRSRSRSRSRSLIRRIRSRHLRRSRSRSRNNSVKRMVRTRSRSRSQKGIARSRSRSRSLKHTVKSRSRSRTLEHIARNRSRSRSFVQRIRKRQFRRSRSRSRRRPFRQRNGCSTLQSRSRSRNRSSMRTSRSRSLGLRRRWLERSRRLSKSRSRGRTIERIRGRSGNRSRSRPRSTSLFQRSGSFEQNAVWQGVKSWDNVKDIQSSYRYFKELVKTEEDSTPEQPLYYFQLTESLCTLIGVSRSRIIGILDNLGVKSLGIKTVCNVYHVIASLLVLIILVRNAWERQNGKTLTLSSTSVIKYTVKDGKYVISIDGTSVTMRNHVSQDFYHGLISWLKKKESELAPLYNCLELGKTRMDFLAKLANIFM